MVGSEKQGTENYLLTILEWAERFQPTDCSFDLYKIFCQQKVLKLSKDFILV